MVKYILKRVLTSILTIWVVVTLTFFMMRLMPGSPFTGEKKLPVAVLQNLEKKYGLDKPLFVQYTTYLGNVVRGDLGPSIYYEGRTVNEIIANSFPVSAKLGAASVLFALIGGLLMGIISALKQGKWQDKVTILIATLGVTVPSFVMATFFIYYFAVKLGWFPAIGLDGLSSYVLPSIALGGYSMAFIARLSRSSLIETLRQDYIRVAKAKGLSGRAVIFKHALKNSIIPVVTYIGPLIAAVLTGSFVVEALFGIPGLGREFVNTISNRDYTVIQGVTIFYGTFLIGCNLIVDIIYGFIDPRIKLQG